MLEHVLKTKKSIKLVNMEQLVGEEKEKRTLRMRRKRSSREGEAFVGISKSLEIFGTMWMRYRKYSRLFLKEEDGDSDDVPSLLSDVRRREIFTKLLQLLKPGQTITKSMADLKKNRGRRFNRNSVFLL